MKMNIESDQVEGQTIFVEHILPPLRITLFFLL